MTRLRKMVLVSGLAVASLTATAMAPVDARQRGYARYEYVPDYSYRPYGERAYRPQGAYYGDEYGPRYCLPEEEGHLGRWTCEYRN